MHDLASFGDFTAAAKGVLGVLQQQLGFALWAVGRAGADWVALAVVDVGTGWGIAEGTAIPWRDTLCSRMVFGAPRVAPSVSAVAEYREAPLATRLPVGAYVGVPLVVGGELFGTLCAMHPTPRAEAAAALPWVELSARLLGTVLEGDLRIGAERRTAERADLRVLTDELTGLWNRRAWERLKSAEESRCLRHAHAAAVVTIDLDGLQAINDGQGRQAGDALLCRTARAIRGATREQDVVARLGGDEFAVLAVQCDPRAAEALVERLREVLSCERIEASICVAQRHASGGMDAVLSQADETMFSADRADRACAVRLAPTSGEHGG